MGLTKNRKEILHRQVRLIVAFTISYNVLEALISIWAGFEASSVALIGFGLDSVVEVLSALAVAWQFARKEPEKWEKVTVRAIAVSFFLLAFYVGLNSVLTLWNKEAPEHTVFGLSITAISLLLMPILAFFESQIGRELQSKSVMSDAKQLLLCIYLSGTVLLGLLLNSLFGWWWADPVAALVVAALAVHEGMEAWKGEVEFPLASI
ncbi:cation transporter [Corynebacterium sp. 13CS0277]|uniref:cation transporter n=1 Tax=Corynebacterium sp. 13CS0277 TaxID=2071994 RepID=UPI001E406B66|nr:cation transporter [Corynebacterium sp. 13CS0277]